MWTISGPSEAHSVKTTRRFCFMRTELNLCEYRPFHLFSGFGQIIQYQHPKWLNHVETTVQWPCVVSFYVIPDIPATAFSYQPRPCPGDPRGPKAPRFGLWGHHLWFKRGKGWDKVSPALWFFQRLHRRNVWFSKMFMFFVLIFASKLMAGIQKIIGRSQGSMIFFEQHPAAEAQALNNCLNTANRWTEWRYGKKTLQVSRIGKIQLQPSNPLVECIWSSPLRLGVLSSAQWRMTCCYTQKCITSWWHILCRILLLDICLPLSCKLRYARKGDKSLYKSQMSCKGWVPINVEPYWTSCEGRVQRGLSEEMWHKVGSPAAGTGGLLGLLHRPPAP